jgi:uncharacterized protein YdhG (YjbR/CyaY superfamily)
MQPSPLIDSYIEAFPLKTIQLLNQVRRTIQQLVPDAEETMKYGIPTYVFHGNLVHFAGYKNHIGFYPGAAGIEAFKEQFKDYEWSKGAVQFPIDKPMPLKLITRIVQFRMQQNLAKIEVKKKKPVLKERAMKDGASKENLNKFFISTLGAPALRALDREGITTLKKLSRYTEKEILALHGIGKSAIPKLQSALQSEGLSFKS